MRKLILLAALIAALFAFSPGAATDASADECDRVGPVALIEDASACAGGGTQYSVWHWESWANHWDCIIIARGVEVERIHDFYCG